MGDTKTVPKAQRLVSLVMFLSEHTAPVTRSQIADGVEGYEDLVTGGDTAAKQFKRDIEALNNMGIGILESDDLKCFSIDSTYGFTSRLDLEHADLARLSQIVEATLDDPSFIYSKDLRYAALKLSNAGAFAETIENPGHSIDYAMTPFDDEVKERARTLDLCCRTSTRVSFRYCNAKGRETTREVEPQGLISVSGELYLVAHERENVIARHFRLSRMSELKPIGAEGAFERIDFDPADWVTFPFSFGPEEEYPAVFLLSDIEIPDGPGYRDASFFESPAFDDKLIMVAPCCDTAAACRWSIVEDGVLPLSPPELVDAYRDTLKRAEAKHGC